MEIKKIAQRIAKRVDFTRHDAKQIVRLCGKHTKKKPKQFEEGRLNTGEEQKINSSIMEWASEIAEALTTRDCKINNIECFVIDEEGSSYTDEAQDIFNAYYDTWTTDLYMLLNQQLKAIS